jgi:hypothetical protein
MFIFRFGERVVRHFLQSGRAAGQTQGCESGPMETDFKQLDQLDEIADITCSLTYGEMIDLAAELWKAAGGAEITAKTLPAILHQWSNEHLHRPETRAPADNALMRADEKITPTHPSGDSLRPFHKG